MEKDLISFGKYLLSKERDERIKTTAKKIKQPIKDARKEIYHADIENWKALNSKMRRRKLQVRSLQFI